LWNSIRIGQGRENAKTYLREHADAAAEIEATIRGNAVQIAEAMAGGPGDLDGAAVEE
jgi:recombination protein RecA